MYIVLFYRLDFTSLETISDHQTEQTAELLKLLAHPVRIQIVLLLTEQQSVNVSTLQRLTNVDQSLVSQHLTKMKDRGILTSVKKGKEIYYSLKDSTFIEAIKLLLDREPG